MPDNSLRTTYDLQNVLVESKTKALWRMLTGFRGIYAIAVVAAGLAALGRTGVAYLLRYFIDDVLQVTANQWLIPWIALGFIGLALFQGFFTYLTGRLAAQTSEGIVRRLRNYIYDHLQRLTFTYHDRMQTGDLISRATSDVDTIRRLYQDQLIGIGRITLLFLVNFAGMLLLDVRLALYSVIVIPVIVAASIYFFKRMEITYESYQSQEAKVSSRLQENLSGVRVVKAFARQEFEIERFEAENWKKYERGKDLARLHATFWPVTDVISGLQMLLAFYLGALATINGDISLGTYLAYSGLVINVIWPIRNLGRLVANISTGVVSLERLQAIIRQQREPLGQGTHHLAARLVGDVRFDDVSFRYAVPASAEEREKAIATKAETPGTNGASSHHPNIPVSNREWVLQNISLHAKPGQVIGLLGATGSGKTSLVNLLPRFYEYTEGSITIDGIQLREIARDGLRAQIGIVQQEPFLFSTTIRGNITYGVGREVSDEEVEAAARAAAVHDVILGFPNGYDTLVGERGVTLSGGQKQRVTIARTLLKNPSILILDDATSSVDTETDAAIREALQKLMENRTTFIIAHRVQSVMEADQILVMDQGRIVQRGTHDELLAEPGIYRRVYDLQARIEEELEREIAEVVEAVDKRLAGKTGKINGRNGAVAVQ
ncbi:MAG: ABC transporter ATP-binding protein/permease [Caldilineaceae bacterium]|nr:ABC transporter ATP-binding protein/permease [Caldilineaceae bacterium]